MQPNEQDWGCTDTGNKDRFIRQWQGKLTYLLEPKQWILWDGEKWTAAFDIYAKAEDTVKGIYVEAANCPDPAGRQRLGQWANTSQRTNVIDSMLKRAAGALGRSIKEFDQNPYILNCKNGIIDLRTKELRKRTSDDLCLQMADAEYHPHAKCPAWLAFLSDVHECDTDLIDYLQLYYGYCTTGLVRDHYFGIFHGDGRNGKDTEADTVRVVQGDYGAAMEFAIFLEKGTSNPRVKEAIGNLKGKRFTVASEADRNSVFDAARIKSHTGGNVRKGGVIHGKAFDYDPSDKLVLSTNYLPLVRDSTVAFWDRVIVVPFNKQYLGTSRDTSLKDKLLNERNGILTWLVEGAYRYLTKGDKLHNKPEAIVRATREYEHANDDLKRFIADKLEKDSSATLPVGETHQDVYLPWFNSQTDNSGEPCPLKFFQERMGKRGVRSKLANGSRFFVGYRLKSTPAEEPHAANDNPEPVFDPNPSPDWTYDENRTKTAEETEAYYQDVLARLNTNKRYS